MDAQLINKLNYLAYLQVEKFAGYEGLLEKELHDAVVNSIFKLKSFIPDEYKQHNLERVIVSKSISYNTSLDKSVRQHFYLKKAISKLVKIDILANIIAGTIIDKKDKRLIKSMLSKTYEDGELSFIDKNFLSEHLTKEIKFLFFASQPSHIKVFDSFFEMSVIENYQIAIPYRLKNQLAFNFINKNKIVYFEEFFPENSKKALLQYKDQFQQVFIENRQEIKELFHFSNKNFFESQEPGLTNVFKYLLPQSLLYSIASENILSSKNVKKIVGVRPRRLMDRALIQKSHKLGLETNLIIHSTLGSDQKELWSSGLFDNLTNVFGWGKKHLSLIEKDSFFEEGKFIAVGSPMFNSPPKIKESNFKKINVIYASTRNDEPIIKALETFKKNNNNISITIKVHPGEAIPDYLCEEIFHIEPGSFAIEDILDKYDIFITPYSGSHISAISEGLPVIFAPFYYEFIQDLDSLYGINKESMNLSYAENEDGLGNLLDKVVQDDKYRGQLILQQVRYFNELLSSNGRKESVSEIDEILALEL